MLVSFASSKVYTKTIVLLEP